MTGKQSSELLILTDKQQPRGYTLQNQLQISKEDTEQERTSQNSELGAVQNKDKGIISESRSSFYSKDFLTTEFFTIRQLDCINGVDQWLPWFPLSSRLKTFYCAYSVLYLQLHTVRCVCACMYVHRFLKHESPHVNLNDNSAHYQKVLVWWIV